MIAFKRDRRIRFFAGDCINARGALLPERRIERATCQQAINHARHSIVPAEHVGREKRATVGSCRYIDERLIAPAVAFPNAARAERVLIRALGGATTQAVFFGEQISDQKWKTYLSSVESLRQELRRQLAA